ncbi:MAG TPA: lysylphosphatidylglycerol synthase transmembrane domain-containing protein [Anaerolineae bacterium]|nr:lysylphosphatidylglycerol synthase transmembrane domain-containing protein [Anaerolineae bacterium]
MKRVNLIRGLFILVIAGFFGYRLFEGGGLVYPVLTVGLGLLGLLSLLDRLSARWQTLGLNLGISLFFLDLVFAEIDLSQVWQAIVNADYVLLALSMAIMVLHIYFRTLRWQWLLKPLGEVSFWPAWRALLIGITGNTFLPARAGEFLRAYVLGRSTGLSKTGVFATLVVERIFDGLTILFVLLAVIVLGVRDPQLQTVGLIGGVFYLGVMVGLFLFMTKRHWVDLLIHKFLPTHLADKVLDLLDNFANGLAVLKNPKQLAMVTLWNMLTWVFVPISMWLTLLALDFGSPVPWQAPVLMLPVMALGLTVPAAPGGVGLVQAAVKLTLDITLPAAASFKESIAAASLLIHFTQFAPEVIPGVFCFLYEGLSTSDLKAGQLSNEPSPVLAKSLE